MRDNKTPEAVSSFRQRCYDCYRPVDCCFCDRIPRISNRTHVLILQHVRERFHAFNTARIVRHALTNCTLIADRIRTLATADLPIQARTGVLYPSDDAVPLAAIPGGRGLDQLIVLDGTWHHAKTMMRDIPVLQTLPRYRLSPTDPSRYRLRREPDAQALSTVEATVAALQDLEPDTPDLVKLLNAFDHMIDTQLRHPMQHVRWRRDKPSRRPSVNIPAVLLGDLRHVVVAYGESAEGQHRRLSGPSTPVYWVAERLNTGERFSAAIQPPQMLTNSFLEHLNLPRSHFDAAIPKHTFQQQWNNFLRADDVLTVYNKSTSNLILPCTERRVRCINLKSVHLTTTKRCSTLDQLLEALKIQKTESSFPGRAGERLANAVALISHLNGLRTSTAARKADKQ